MEEEEEDTYQFGRGPTPALPAVVPLATYSSPYPRRLSSCFREPRRAIPAARRTLASVSLQGRLVGAQEATSARTVGLGLSSEEAAAWELFSPLHRVLIVATVAVATAESRRSRRMSQFQQSVDLRIMQDQELLSMQQKLDDLCELLKASKDESMENARQFFSEDEQFVADGILKQKEIELCSYVHPFPKLNPESEIVPLHVNLSNWPKDVNEMDTAKEDAFKRNLMNIGEQEERRMSDLSDFCSSISSSGVIQLSALAEEQQFYNLQKECEEKDTTIKELSAAANASSAAASKRIAELEEIIKRKNLVITRLKKDMVILEQKAIQLMRLQRSSSSASNISLQLPVMKNNILYDLSSTSPSSSDSDSSAKQQECQSHGLVTHDSTQWCSSVDVTSLSSAKSCGSSTSSTDRFPKQCYVGHAKDSHGPHSYESLQECATMVTKREAQPSANFANSLSRARDRFPKKRNVNPVEENYSIHRDDSAVTLKAKISGSSGGDFKRTRRHTQSESKSRVSRKRGV